VRADRSALEQILLNLVDNACKYAAGSDPPAIEIELRAADGSAAIRVRDHGKGVSPAGRRRLFRPFSKSDRDAANSAPGIGLGLALSRRLARAQGGELSLESSGPEGAAFVLTLPLVRSR
jgi:signal transduction histidine kinase